MSLQGRNAGAAGLAAVASMMLLQCADTTTFTDAAVLPDGPAEIDTGSASCPEVPCPGGTICHRGSCIPDQGACERDDTCLGDTFCEIAAGETEGRCLPYTDSASSGSGSGRTNDPLCQQGHFSAERFEPPVVACHYSGVSALSTPVVIDLDGDDKPEIVLVSYAQGDVGGALVALRGSDCTQVVFQVDAGLAPRSQLAAAQLAGDERPEIVAIDKTNRVVVFDHAGNKIATSDEPAAPGASSFHDGGAAIADLDRKSPPEVVYGAMALRLQDDGALVTLYNHPAVGGHWGTLSAVADVDLDGTPEVVVGNRIFDGPTGVDETPAPAGAWGGGYAAIVQWDSSTPEPEIALVSSQASGSGTLRVYHPVSGQVVFGPYDFGQQFGGPPTVADFDGDGEPEIGAAGYVGYLVFDQQCAVDPLPAVCHSPGVRWLKQTRDHSSGSTGSSVFDFNGDGEAEVVYRDECWLRVYDGRSGVVRFAHNITSGTILELPVVADVDADGHADLVVPSEDTVDDCESEPEVGLPADASGTRGILVLRDPMNRWAPSRAIWNQHSYHITNVNDDGTVPLPEPGSWETHNSYRQNAQGDLAQARPAADITAGQAAAIEPESCAEAWPLTARACNRGAADAQAGIAVTFYEGDPRAGGAKTICTATTSEPLAPGACVTVECDWKSPPEGSVDLWVAADDDGSGAETIVECREENNLLHLPKSACRPLQ